MQQLAALILVAILWTPLVTCAKADGFSSCVPDDVQLKSQIQEQPPAKAEAKSKTLGAKLIELKAQCRKGKLVDRHGKEIRIVHLIGCWGNPPEDYQEQLDRQQEELKRLRDKYTVILIPCPRDKTRAD
jgi:hypothetical protein